VVVTFERQVFSPTKILTNIDLVLCSLNCSSKIQELWLIIDSFKIDTYTTVGWFDSQVV
jgi:hypothetical protein